jgi:hypothetical protein
MRYLNQFLNLKCFGDLFNTGVIKDVGQLSEAGAVYGALDFLNKSDPHIGVMVLGERRSPYIGTSLAFRTQWHVTSVMDVPVDPQEHVVRFAVGKKGDEYARPSTYFHRSIVVSVGRLDLAVFNKLLPFKGNDPITVVQLFDRQVKSDAKRVYRDEDILTPNKWVYVWEKL